MLARPEPRSCPRAMTRCWSPNSLTSWIAGAEPPGTCAAMAACHSTFPLQRLSSMVGPREPCDASASTLSVASKATIVLSGLRQQSLDGGGPCRSGSSARSGRCASSDECAPSHLPSGSNRGTKEFAVQQPAHSARTGIPTPATAARRQQSRSGAKGTLPRMRRAPRRIASAERSGGGPAGGRTTA